MNTGERVGKLTAIRFLETVQLTPKKYNHLWEFQCDCGTIVKRSLESLRATIRNGGSPLCSACHHANLRPPPRQPKHLDIAGQTFGNLTALEPTGELDKRRYTIWRFQCTCGNIVTKSTGEVVTPSRRPDNTPSCGKSKCNGHHKLAPGQSAINRLFERYTRGARDRNYCFELSKEQFADLITQSCYYCGTPPKKVSERDYSRRYIGEFYANGIDRKDNTQGYTIENSVSCCAMCNRAKNDIPLEDFLKWIDALAKHAANL